MFTSNLRVVQWVLKCDGWSILVTRLIREKNV